MRLGLVTDFYYPWIGGPARIIRNIGDALSARGHDVALLAPSPDGRPYRESDGPIDVFRASTIPFPIGFRLRVSSRPLSSVRDWLRTARPDVVHVHHPFPLSAAAVLECRRQGIPVVATNHTIPECALWGLRNTPLYGPSSGAFGAWLRWLLHRCDAVATPTSTAASLLRDLGFSGPIEVISNGVDTGRFQPGVPSADLRSDLGLDSRPVVLYTGRLDAEKQMDVWLNAAARVCEEMDVQFVVGGDGSVRSQLEIQAGRLRLSSVRFIGYLDEARYPDLYRQADVYCISSPVELQSISTLEALASGLPVVAVRAGALPELVIDGWNGALAAPGDADAVARAIMTVLGGNTSIMGERSRELALSHDLSRTMDGYEHILFGRRAEACSERTSV